MYFEGEISCVTLKQVSKVLIEEKKLSGLICKANRIQNV